MSDCWSILGIDPDADTRTIKRAYAVLLKKTKPDEDPQGFQDLHAAYQQALGNETPLSPPASAPEASTNDIVLSVVDADGGQHYQTPGVESRPALSDDDQSEMAALLTHLDRLLAKPQKIYQPGQWDFLTEAPNLLDEHFRIAVGIEVLRRIGEHNRKNRSTRRKMNQVGGTVISNLNTIFLWSLQPELYLGCTSDENFWHVLSLIDVAAPGQTQDAVGGKRVDSKPSKGQGLGKGVRMAMSIVLGGIAILFLAYVGASLNDVRKTANRSEQFLATTQRVFNDIVQRSKSDSSWPATTNLDWQPVITGSEDLRGTRLEGFHILAADISRVTSEHFQHLNRYNEQMLWIVSLLDSYKGTRYFNNDYYVDRNLFVTLGGPDKARLFATLEELAETTAGAKDTFANTQRGVWQKIAASGLDDEYKTKLRIQWDRFFETVSESTVFNMLSKERYVRAYLQYANYLNQTFPASSLSDGTLPTATIEQQIDLDQLKEQVTNARTAGI